MAYIRAPFAVRRSHDAGWSSPVARQAHNLKVTSSNLVPATKILRNNKDLKGALSGAFFAFGPVEALWKQEGAQLRALLRGRGWQVSETLAR